MKNTNKKKTQEIKQINSKLKNYKLNIKQEFKKHQ